MAVLYVSEGVDELDIAVPCTKAVTLAGTALYLGTVTGLAGQQVLGASDADYGVWTAAAKAGSRLTVLADGVPSSTSEILWDLATGRLYTTTSRTVYVRYRKYAELRNEGRVLTINVPAIDATGEDLAIVSSPWDIKVSEIAVNVAGNLPPSTALTLQLRTGVGGTGSAATATVSADTAVSGWLSLSTPLRWQPGDPICVRSTSGTGFTDVQLLVREVIE